MDYYRVVLAVKPEDRETFDLHLDEFIECSIAVQGAYVSKPYANRSEALGNDWKGA